jgi:hypothetical protein
MTYLPGPTSWGSRSEAVALTACTAPGDATALKKRAALRRR